MSTCHSYNWKTFNSCTQAWPTWARGGTATGAGLLTLNRVWKSSDKQSIKEVWVYWKLLIYRGDSWVAGRVSRRLIGQEFSCFQEGSTMSQRPHSHQKILRKEGAMCVNRRAWEWHIFISTCFSRRFIGPMSRDSWPLRSWPSSADLQQGSGCPGCHLLLTPCWDPGKSHAPPGAKDCGGGLYFFLHMHLKEETVNLLEIRISWWVLAMLKHPRSFKQEQTATCDFFATSRLACHTEHLYGKLPIYTCIKADNKNNGSIWASSNWCTPWTQISRKNRCPYTDWPSIGP